MARRDVETVSLSFLDLLSCALGGVILLMLIFTAVMYGKYSHRKTLVVYADAGLSHDVTFVAISPFGERIKLESKGTVFMVKERPAFGEWRIVAKRKNKSTTSPSEELKKLISYLEATTEGNSPVNNWLPFDEATKVAGQASKSVAASRNSPKLDIGDLRLLQSGVFSICNSSLGAEQDVKENSEVSKTCDTVLKTLAGTREDDVEKLVKGLFSVAFSTSTVTVDGRPDHGDRLAFVNRSLNLLAVFCALHSQLSEEHEAARNSVAIAIKSIIDEYLYMCRECDLLKQKLPNGEHTDSGVTHEAAIAYQLSLFINKVRRRSFTTRQFLRTCLAKNIELKAASTSFLLDCIQQFSSFKSDVEKYLNQNVEKDRQLQVVLKHYGYDEWDMAVYLNEIASSVVGATPYKDLTVLVDLVEDRSAVLDLKKAGSISSATLALVTLASLDGQDGHRLDNKERVQVASTLSLLFKPSTTSVSLTFLENEQSLLLKQAAADALRVVVDATTEPTVVSSLNLHWGGNWESLPDISLPISSSESDIPILSFAVSHDDLSVHQLAFTDGDKP
ncbi:hypothetical protein [Gimesia aquarii]|uniref:Uncharacterized protein n=1 Tax=Gimesia aquarii TaxID=2527964 RepID=A0A517WWK3_9PLAN|nr:hypothetical protein [Gimesia aquarii]QDU09653.1 hypothetical protein V202x_30290 [Gimesia aquarii]